MGNLFQTCRNDEDLIDRVDRLEFKLNQQGEKINHMIDLLKDTNVNPWDIAFIRPTKPIPIPSPKIEQHSLP